MRKTELIIMNNGDRTILNKVIDQVTEIRIDTATIRTDVKYTKENLGKHIRLTEDENKIIHSRINRLQKKAYMFMGGITTLWIVIQIIIFIGR